MDDREFQDAEDDLDRAAQALGETGAVAARFAGELSSLKGEMTWTQREAAGLARSFGGSLKRAFDGVAFDGDRLSDALKGLAESMVNAAYNTAMKPVSSAVGGAVTAGLNAVLPFAEGGAFAQGRVMPFASGGVVTGPTTFAMRGGTGLMGEAGPEAIMPLKRGPDGRLGVAGAGGGGPVTVNMTVRTPDAESFRRSRGQIAAQMQRALSRGARNR
jgi:phage-related minor tail protein